MARLKLSPERIRNNAAAATRGGGDIRAKVRDLTLRALRGRRPEPAELKAVLHAMTEGIASGAIKRPGNTRAALTQAFRGLDEAVGKAAEASRPALRELVSGARDIQNHEVRRTIGNLRRLEADFLSTVGKAARSAEPKVKRELHAILIHAQRAGTDTGRKVAATLWDFSRTMGSILADNARAGLDTTRDVGARFADLASGLLAGMADALRAKHRALKPTTWKRTRKAEHK